MRIARLGLHGIFLLLKNDITKFMDLKKLGSLFPIFQKEKKKSTEQ
jgi:hypothetical protein